jgi:hypothetical protein
MKVSFFVKKDSQIASLGKHSWHVPRLIELVKGLEVMEIPLDHLNVYCTYEKMTLRELAGHMVAVNEADLSFPIIMDEDGEIMDGRHRIMKALIEGEKTIKAVRFSENPSPCKVEV